MVRGTYLALDHMKKDKGGKGGVIVNVASLAGLLNNLKELHHKQKRKQILCILCISTLGLGPLFPTPVYTATKHGVVGFTRAMAVCIYQIYQILNVSKL